MLKQYDIFLQEFVDIKTKLINYFFLLKQNSSPNLKKHRVGHTNAN